MAKRRSSRLNKEVKKSIPKRRKGKIKYFLTYIGPPCKLQVPGIGVIKRKKEYEVAKETADSFRGSVKWRIDERFVEDN